MRTHTKLAAALVALAVATSPAPAFAWGATGHEMVSGAAVDGLSKSLPGFLRTKTARAQIALLGREPDRWRGAGRTHDAERDPAHYISISPDGKISTLFTIDAIPQTRGEFEKTINVAGARYPGYLPYAMIDGYQQIVKDFGYWRASKIGSKTARTKADREWFAADMKLREAILIRDIGVWSHYVADASQPQHVTEFHNGWAAEYADPMTYPPPGLPREIYGIHAYFEGPFVKTNVTPAALRKAMPAYRDCGCTFEQRAAAFIANTFTFVRPLYQLAASKAIMAQTPEAVDFATVRLAAGAAEVRDGIEDAWKASATSTVGYPNINVADIESGKVILTRDMYGAD
jgi:hypothetical protein